MLSGFFYYKLKPINNDNNLFNSSRKISESITVILIKLSLLDYELIFSDILPV
jgi:hypothetical protein